MSKENFCLSCRLEFASSLERGNHRCTGVMDFLERRLARMRDHGNLEEAWFLLRSLFKNGEITRAQYEAGKSVLRQPKDAG